MIFLIGYRGTGKSTVARLLADALGWPWLDADTVLEREHGTTIRDLFAVEGETSFRDKETALLTQFATFSNHVIATGGGVVLRESNRTLLRSSGWVVWLTADANTIHRRLQGDFQTAHRRPALTAHPPLEEIAELTRVREPLYRSCAHLIVPTVNRLPAEVADEIQAAWLSHQQHPV